VILLIPEYNRLGFMLGIPGLVLQTGASFMAPMFQPMLGDSATTLTTVLSFCGMALVIAGLAYVAKAKGYHWALGFLGLFSCIGLIIIAVLPDKSPGPVPYYGSFGHGPPPPGGPGWGPGPHGYTAPQPQNPYAAPNQQGWGQPPQGGPPGGQGPQGGWGSGGWGGPPPA
jgi:hypothetical protein